MDKQKELLLTLVSNTDGEDWSQQHDSGWRADATSDVCYWDGIRCDSGAVYEINLENTELATTIPKQLGELSSLTHLYLANNALEGEIPNEVAKLPKLVQIDLSTNELTGDFPIFTSPDLQVINLSHNKLSGELPANTENTGGDKLEILDIKYNRIGGPIPDTIGKISSSLKELDLSNNKFDGSIPSSLGNLLKLEGLFLSNNKLDGEIPASLTRTSLALSQIFLHGNELSGTLPVAFADLPNLKNLFIDDNKITGTVPEDLCALGLNEIFFQAGELISVQGGDDKFEEEDAMDLNNDKSGNSVNIAVEGIDNPVEVPVVQEGEVVDGEDEERKRRVAEAEDDTQGTLRDGCNSIACPAGYRSIGIGKNGVFPCEKCHHQYLNPYIGASSCLLIDQFEVMANFYILADGKNWVGDYGNWHRKDIPVCSWEGISCNKEGDIVSIVLPNSNLDGTIYPNVGLLRHLEVLDLSDNSLKGEVPAELHFAPLEKLDLTGNMLEGFVPPTLCEKGGVNGNGEGGEFSCDRIMCAAGESSATGRAEKGGACTKCPGKHTYLGSKDCGTSITTSGMSESSPFRSSAENTHEVPNNVIITVASALVALVMVGVVVMLARFHKKKRDDKFLDMKDDGFTDPESEVPSVYISNSMPPPSDTIKSGTFPVEGGTFPVSVQVKAKNAWNSGKQTTKEVWLDVPKIN
mmetsp:Transcript_44193/g.64978  ORF Transcript_44193/g.64978 Transcript_44193/m.64978 type:complete len:693 (-) Transcript_44193:362-2440(-)